MREDPNWERKLIHELATAAWKEKRASRRWGIFFKFLLAIYLVVVFLVSLGLNSDGLQLKSDAHTALVDLTGVIAQDAPANADRIIKGLRSAFKHKGTKGVILRINSPGGSPVQSSEIHNEMLRLRKKYPKIPLYVVVVDTCASGGYFIASAADRIYANPSSIVGSIGVIMNGFGFVGAIEKLGVERRLLTAGDHKGILDPFSPIKEEEQAHVKALMAKLHQHFIAAVKEGRGDRLAKDERLFSGLFWSGEESKALGLIDDFGNASYVAREVVKVEKLVDFTPQDDLLERFAGKFGASASTSMMQAARSWLGWGGFR